LAVKPNPIISRRSKDKIDIFLMPPVGLLTTRYKPEISERVTQSAASFPCVVITGARQPEKTTLLKTLFLDYEW